MATTGNNNEKLRQEFRDALPRLREILLGLSQEQKRSWAQHIVHTRAGLERDFKKSFRGSAVEEMMLKEVFNLAKKKNLDPKDAFRDTIAWFAAKRQPKPAHHLPRRELRVRPHEMRP